MARLSPDRARIVSAVPTSFPPRWNGRRSTAPGRRERLSLMTAVAAPRNASMRAGSTDKAGGFFLSPIIGVCSLTWGRSGECGQPSTELQRTTTGATVEPILRLLALPRAFLEQCLSCFGLAQDERAVIVTDESIHRQVQLFGLRQEFRFCEKLAECPGQRGCDLGGQFGWGQKAARGAHKHVEPLLLGCWHVGHGGP